MTTIEQLALRCILPGFEGTAPPDWLRRRAADGLGGVVLFARNIAGEDELARLNASLHAERPAMLVAVDEEGGDVTRLEARSGSSYPGNLALGATHDPSLTEAVARAIGADLARTGVDVNFAPVADLNADARNPVIGVRSFGSEPGQVAQHTAAWVRGLQSAGIAACAKHFPGHGDTAADSHLELPVAASNPHDGALAPFDAAIAAGVRAIMSAHILVPALDDAPATLSQRAMTDLLRGEMAFSGLAVSDALDMRGVSAGRGIPEAAVLALAAGCVALCVGASTGVGIVDEIASAIADAVRQGRLREERLREAAGRVDALAEWRKGQTGGAEVDRAVGLAAARRALCREGDVSVRGSASVVSFASEPSIAAGAVPWGMAEALASHGVHVTGGEVAHQNLVVVVRDLHRLPEQRAAAEAVIDRRPDAVVVDMGVPVYRPRGVRGYLATYGAARVCAEAAAEVLTG